MKISITSVSSIWNKYQIIEVDSIDEAIKRLQTDKGLVKSIINEKDTFLKKDLFPERFVVKTYSEVEGCDCEIEIYDYYRE